MQPNTSHIEPVCNNFFPQS